MITTQFMLWDIFFLALFILGLYALKKQAKYMANKDSKGQRITNDDIERFQGLGICTFVILMIGLGHLITPFIPYIQQAMQGSMQ